MLGDIGKRIEKVVGELNSIDVDEDDNEIVKNFINHLNVLKYQIENKQIGDEYLDGLLSYLVRDNIGLFKDISSLIYEIENSLK